MEQKMIPFLPLLSFELSVSVKENPDREKNPRSSTSFEKINIPNRKMMSNCHPSWGKTWNVGYNMLFSISKTITCSCQYFFT